MSLGLVFSWAARLLVAPVRGPKNSKSAVRPRPSGALQAGRRHVAHRPLWLQRSTRSFNFKEKQRDRGSFDLCCWLMKKELTSKSEVEFAMVGIAKLW